MVLTVGIAGLGAIGLDVARALDAGIPGLALAAVSARDAARARERVAGFRAPPAILDLAGLAQADIVVEAAPAAIFDRIAEPAIEAGRILVPLSVGALLPRMHLVERARQTGARIVVPTGALLGLDAVRAAAEGAVESVTIETRKPPGGLAGAPYLVEHGIDARRPDRADARVRRQRARRRRGLSRPTSTSPRRWPWPASGRSARGSRSGPIPASPATPTRSASRPTAARFTMTIEGVPSESNPRTGRLTPLSVIACLRGLTATLRVGS